MTVLTWFKKELGILHTEIVAIEPEVIAWAKNFLAGVTPILRQTATDAVIAAVSVPGNGEIKFAAAVATASAELLAKGVPFIDGQLKAVVQIAYDALPHNVAVDAVAHAVDTKIDQVAAHVGS